MVHIAIVTYNNKNTILLNKFFQTGRVLKNTVVQHTYFLTSSKTYILSNFTLRVKYSLIRNSHDDLALKIKIVPEEFIQENVCSIKNYECDNDSCEHCSNNNNIRDNRYYKDEVVDTGKDVTKLLNDVSIKSFKIHVYNIHHQYSKLKYKKNNVKGDEIILSVHFSKNYDNKP